MDGTITNVSQVLRKRPARQSTVARRLLPYLAATAVTGCALLLAHLIAIELAVGNVTLIFLASVVFCAARWGLPPALLACVLSVLSLNFFFLPPLHNLAVDDPDNIVTVLVFVGVAVFIGRLTARARADARLAGRRAQTMEDLYVFARRLTTINDLAALTDLTVGHVAAALGVEVILILPEREELAARAAIPAIETIESADVAAAADRWLSARSADGCVGQMTTAHFLFLPLQAVKGLVGVLGLSQAGQPPLLSLEDRRFVDAIADQVAVAIERLSLAEDVERARVTVETESLRSAMLSAISHDLKTPLASILGAATSLGSYNSYFEQQERDDLVATIREETERMSRFVANLLDITRVESGSLEVTWEATDIEEVIGAAVRRARPVLGSHRLNLRVADDLPMLNLDGVLLEQTIFNLLDNAGKYSPLQSTIAIDARRINDRIVIKVLDEGPGIPPPDLTRIFEKFYRSGHRGRQRAGTGLGLAICRGFVEAMGGRIIAGNRTDRSGAVIMMGFPLSREAERLRLPDSDDD